jgi:hypothetical protein
MNRDGRSHVADGQGRQRQGRPSRAWIAQRQSACKTLRQPPVGTRVNLRTSVYFPALLQMLPRAYPRGLDDRCYALKHAGQRRGGGAHPLTAITHYPS